MQSNYSPIRQADLSRSDRRTKSKDKTRNYQRSIMRRQVRGKST